VDRARLLGGDVDHRVARVHRPRVYAGLEFYYRGEAATLYTGIGCAGTPYRLFEDTQACGDFGWRSINIDC
jgi:hypothetical protein